MCDAGDVEDEYHFTLICSRYNNDIRRLYLKQYYYRCPSVFKFIQLMQSDSYELKKLCRYVHEAFNIRKTYLNNRI